MSFTKTTPDISDPAENCTAENFSVSETQAAEILAHGKEKAAALLKDGDKMERFLQQLENKLNLIPLVGDKLATVPILASLLRSYVKKEYQDIPTGSLLAIISALLYFVSPIDLIPDSIPLLGYTDDAAVVAVCWKLVWSDAEDYKKWRERTGKLQEF